MASINGFSITIQRFGNMEDEEVPSQGFDEALTVTRGFMDANGPYGVVRYLQSKHSPAVNSNSLIAYLDAVANGGYLPEIFQQLYAQSILSTNYRGNVPDRLSDFWHDLSASVVSRAELLRSSYIEWMQSQEYRLVQELIEFGGHIVGSEEIIPKIFCEGTGFRSVATNKILKTKARQVPVYQDIPYAGRKFVFQLLPGWHLVQNRHKVDQVIALWLQNNTLVCRPNPGRFSIGPSTLVTLATSDMKSK